MFGVDSTRHLARLRPLGATKIIAVAIITGQHTQLTRGHNLRLNKFRVKYDLRKYYFTSRIVNVWNSLSSFVVSADSVNCFKNRLDKFWSNQDIIYDYQAEIHGTGNRSEVVL